MIQPGLAKIEGFVKIFDPVSGEVLIDKKKELEKELENINKRIRKHQ
jgi:hypothetical protein